MVRMFVSQTNDGDSTSLLPTFRLLIFTLFLFLFSVSIQPVVKPLRLFLWGGGHISIEAQTRFMKLAGGKIVVINYASEEPEKAGGVWVGKPGVVLYNKKLCLSDISGVWMTGGDQLRLVKTGIAPLLLTLFHRGAIIGGTSAGASAVSSTMVYNERTAKGFGLTEIVVDQHFDKRHRLARLKKIVDAKHGALGIGLDECTGLVIIDGEAEVIGVSTVTVYNGVSTKRFASGSKFTLR